MRVGSLVYATDQGLGILAKSFYDGGIVTDVCVVRHGRHPTHEEWYPGSLILGSLEITPSLVEWMNGLDVFLAFETPFIWQLFDYARMGKVKTVLMPMHECLHRNVWEHTPDLFLCPSELDLRVIAEHQTSRRLEARALHVPVPVEVPWRQRTRAEVFVYNAGHGGLRGRNGTLELIEAFKYVKSDARLVVRAQTGLNDRGHSESCPSCGGRITYKIGTVPYKDLWEAGDVFVFPEKFNGLSLPLQEARAAGMLVMCGDRFPMNRWLPSEPLIPVKDYNRGQRIGPPYQPFDEAVFDPKDIAATIDAWYGRDISEYSLGGKVWAESMSWAKLGPVYKQLLGELCG